MDSIKFFPSQIALILGITQRDILEWVMDGKVPAYKMNRSILIDTDDLAAFLAEHPIYVGRVYCEDWIPYYNDIRKDIVEKMEGIRSANQHKSDRYMHRV